MNVWKQRIDRRVRDLKQHLEQGRQELVWRLGGERFYTRYVSQLARAHQWCFIVGCNNSGTSLLHRILEKTGQVSTFELEGQRYTRVLAPAHRSGHERVWSEFIDDLRLTEKDGLEHLPRLLNDWLEALDSPIQPMIVEKTTANAVRMRWLEKAFPGAKFIGMVRNGYAVVEGIKRKGHKSVERGARHWEKVNRVMCEDAERLDAFMWLRYEDLVDAQNESARAIGEFLGLDPGLVERGLKEEYAFETVRGASPLPIKNLNQDSIARLSDKEKNAIEQRAGRMLEAFGYSVSPGVGSSFTPVYPLRNRHERISAE